MRKVNLPNVLMVIVDTKNYAGALYAWKRSLREIEPGGTVFVTDITLPKEDWMGKNSIIVSPFSPINNTNDYSRFLINGLPSLLNNLGLLHSHYSHVLIIQHDGFVLDGRRWHNKMFEFDYIGAPWLYVDGRNVGNGGFSLRSIALMKAIAGFTVVGPEDECIGRLWRGSLELSGFKFATESWASVFSFELNKPNHETFGFHGTFHLPYRKRIRVSRAGAMGDVIQVEPLLEYFFKIGYDVYLETAPQFYELFQDQEYPIYFYDDQNFVYYSLHVNLNGAYEGNPTKNHIEAYFETAKVDISNCRNARIKHSATPRIFKNKYVVFHIDKRPEVYRNPVFNWDKLAFELSCGGYDIILVGNGEALQEVGVGIKVDTNDTQILKNVIGNADMFIGVDSGISHLAVAMGVPSKIHFGSVLPHIIHYNLDDIDVKIGMCEHQGCWHEIVGGESGQPCKLNLETPKCCIHE